jgi:hypothetical protein
VWDVSPAYLNRGSLLGEHREIHAVLSVIVNGRTGYARHPETMRWRGHVGALRRRHDWVVAEMRLRGYRHHTPAPHRGAWTWPDVYVDRPGAQFRILGAKYETREAGRVPLPRSVQELWAQHKYSVMARDPAEYRRMGAAVAGCRRGTPLASLGDDLAAILRQPVPEGRLLNANEHLWGYLPEKPALERRSPSAMLGAVWAGALRIPYLWHSTALSDLALWCRA